MSAARYLRRGNLTLDVITGTITAAGGKGHLTPREAQILALLMLASKPIRRAALIDVLYDDDPNGGPDNDNIISVWVARLRQKLAAIGTDVAIPPNTRASLGYEITGADPKAAPAVMRAFTLAQDRAFLRILSIARPYAPDAVALFDGG